MATATEPILNPPASAVPEAAQVATGPGLPEGMTYRLTAEDYFKMVDADIIPPHRRVGLWEGQLYEKMAKKLPHSGASSLAVMALARVLPEGWCIWPENPVLIDDFTTPLPDVSVVRGTANVHTRRGSVPKAAEIGLVVELADTSLKKDLTVSLPIYARAGLPVYWVVNLVARRLQVHSHPVVEGESARYSVVDTFEPGKDLPLVLDGREVARIPARELLPEEAS